MFYRQSRANLGYVAILSNAENFDVCTVTMGVACIIFCPLGRNMIAIFGPDKI